MTTPHRVSQFKHLKGEKIKRLEQLLKTQSKDVSRIVENRSKYNLEDILRYDEDGVHVFPDEYREKRQLTAKGKAREEKDKQILLEWSQAKTCNLPPGMTATRVENPFNIEQFPTFSLRGNRWIDEINNALDDLDSILPRAPFVWPFIGGINAGKTNAIAHVLAVYMHWCFQNVWFVSPTGRLDPTIDTIACSIPPHDAPNKTKFEFFSRIPEEKIEEAAQAVIMQNTPAGTVASRGKYTDRPDTNTKATIQLLPPPSISTPDLDLFGNPVTHTGLLPNEFLKPAVSDSLHHLSSMLNRMPANPFMTQAEKEIGYGISKDDVIETASIPWNRDRKITKLTELTTTDDAASTLYDADFHTYHLARTPFKQTLNVDLQDFVGGREHAGVFKHDIYKNALLVLDDCNQIFGDKSQKKAIKSFITEIRHRHMCMILGAQKSTLIPREIWAQAIAACIWSSRDERQRRRIKEDYGSNVPNFDWVFDYCTRPDPENNMPNPFMYINLSTNPPKVYKCFTEEITWDPDVAEVPKKLSMNSTAELMKGYSVQSTIPPRRSKAARTLVSDKPAGGGTSRVK